MTQEPPREPEPLIVEGLVVERGTFRVGPVSIEVAKGEAVALLGANGSGKSTLVLAILGLLPSVAGRVAVNGAVVDRRRPPTGTGALLSWPGLYDWVSGRHNLRLAAEGDPGALGRVDELLTEVGLAGAAHRPVREYSTGMRKRLELARALLFEPRLLVLDEPTSGLDDDARHWLAERLSSLRLEPRGLLVATHDSDFVAAVGARAISLQRGALFEDGATA